MFNEKFPGGFTPRFGGTVRDWSGAVGIRGDISDWHYDLSAVFGQHSTEFFMKQTINPQLASRRTNIPTNYKPGTYVERDRVINLDLARSLPTAMLPSPLNIGLGLEYRVEEFETVAGEENSWFIDESPEVSWRSGLRHRVQRICRFPARDREEEQPGQLRRLRRFGNQRDQGPAGRRGRTI